jgi:hypothetical protein
MLEHFGAECEVEGAVSEGQRRSIACYRRYLRVLDVRLLQVEGDYFLEPVRK